MERERSLLGQENTLSLCLLLSSSFPFPEFLFLSFQSYFCLCKVFDLSLPDFFPDLFATKRVAVERESSLLVQENTSRWRRWPFIKLISFLN